MARIHQFASLFALLLLFTGFAFAQFAFEEEEDNDMDDADLFRALKVRVEDGRQQSGKKGGQRNGGENQPPAEDEDDNDGDSKNPKFGNKPSKPNNDKGNDKDKDDKKQCKMAKECYKDSDCGGDDGYCFGLFVAKCDCSPCVTGFMCSIGASIHGAPCGGLAGACNSTSGFCDCNMGYQKAGFTNTSSAIMRFCSREDCKENRDSSCHGLPCRVGTCMCGGGLGNKKKTF